MGEDSWRAEEYARELAALKKIRRRMRAVFAAMDEAPQLWFAGDGEGGAMRDLFAAIGVECGYEPRPRLPADPSRRRALSWGTRYRVMERDDFTCQDCGARKVLTIDHVVALANGGSDDEDNLQTLCRPCNTAKGVR